MPRISTHRGRHGGSTARWPRGRFCRWSGKWAGGMRVVIAGGHGKIALLLERLLAERGDQAVGLVRNPAHVADMQKAGADAVICDLEAASDR